MLGPMSQNDLPRRLRELAFDHVAMAVHELDLATEPYRLLGFEAGEDETLTAQGVRVRMLEAGDSRIELLEPTAPDTPVGRFLRDRGPGVHHIALRVSSVSREMERLAKAGARFTDPSPRPGHGGSRVAFLHPKWTGGPLFELVERSAPSPHTPSREAGE
jgi:methylmalonyl-CoA/ethylmalonyl-CoA epimerase